MTPADLPAAFLSRMRSRLGEAGYSAYLHAMELPSRRALRVNSLKCDAEELFSLFARRFSPEQAPLPERTGLSANGYFLPEGVRPGSDPLHLAGLYYMQEPSAQFPAELLNPLPGERVLDLCAAPGGKSGQLAALMENRGVLLANEPVPARAAILSGTLERLGVTNALVTNLYPDALCPGFPEYFDRVLVDAPCSGEGMFRREPDAARDWSPAHVEACAERQRAILRSAASCLRPGGRMVYSTCTFSPEENEETVEAFLSEHPGFTLLSEHRFYPHTSPGEGQFAALFEKADEAGAVRRDILPGVPKEKDLLPYRRFEQSSLTAPLQGSLMLLPDGRLLLLPELLPEGFEKRKLLRTGLLLGEIKKDRFEPSHSLFLALPAGAFRQTVSLQGEALSRYLAGETVPCDVSLSGYAAVCAEGHPLGCGKAVQGTLKNHLPKGLRVRGNAAP